MADINNINVQDRINAWESETFQAKQNALLFGMVIGFLPENTFSEDENYNVSYYGNGMDATTISPKEAQAREREKQRIIQRNNDGAVQFLSNSVAVDNLPGENAVRTVNLAMDKAQKELLSQSQKRGDVRIKRLYSDMAEMFIPDTGKKYSQMFFTSPYLPDLSGRYMSLVNPQGRSSKMLKAQLGLPLYETVLDFMHAIAEEVKTDYRMQEYQINNDGRGRDYENGLLTAIYNSHKNILGEYGKLKEFYDDAQGQTGRYLGNKLSNLFGRNSDTRHIQPAIGMIRGETQAIQNGWDRDELFVLGAIGGIEAEIKRQEEYGSTETKAQISQFKSQFYQLKNECYYTIPESAAQKKEIADKVRVFLQASRSPEASAAAKNCCQKVVEQIRKFDQIDASLQDQIAWERQHGTRLKNKLDDPAEHMQRMQADAVIMEDYRAFVLEYLHLKEKVELELPENDPKRVAFEQQMNEYLDSSFRDAPEIQKAVTELYLERQVEYGMQLEQKARDIREGREKLPRDYEAIKSDKLFSKRMANRLLLDSGVNKSVLALEELNERYINGLHNRLDVENIKKKYLDNALDDLSKGERRAYLKSAEERSTHLQNDFGISGDDLNLLGDPLDKDSVIKTLRKETNNIKNYTESFETAKTTAHEYLVELRQLAAGRSSNSQSFNNMLNALETVDSLSVGDSPKKISEAYRNLGAASKAYEDKIIAQTFAAYFENGAKRKTMSQNLQTFANDKFVELSVVPENIEVDKSLSAQTNELEDVKRTFAASIKRDMQAKVNDKISSVKEKFFAGYNKNLNLEENKENLAIGLGEVLLLNTVNNGLRVADTFLVSSSDISDDTLMKNYLKVSKDKSFKNMMDSVKGEADYTKLCDKIRENPASILEEMNNHKPEQKEVANNNNIIQNQGPKLSM